MIYKHLYAYIINNDKDFVVSKIKLNKQIAYIYNVRKNPLDEEWFIILKFCGYVYANRDLLQFSY